MRDLCVLVIPRRLYLGEIWIEASDHVGEQLVTKLQIGNNVGIVSIERAAQLAKGRHVYRVYNASGVVQSDNRRLILG